MLEIERKNKGNQDKNLTLKLFNKIRLIDLTLDQQMIKIRF